MNYDSVWLARHAVTMRQDDQYDIIDDAAIAVADGKIAWVGARYELSNLDACKNVHDYSNCWMTPGLIDCHTHLVYAGNRSQEFEQRLTGVSYAEIAQRGGGIRSTMLATREADADTLLACSEKRLTNLMNEGVTTIEIKSGYGLQTDAEIKSLQVARELAKRHPISVYTTFLGAHAVPPEFTGKADAYIDYICEEMLPKIASLGLADAVDAFCETIGFTSEQVDKVFSKAREYNLPVKLHAEQLSDQNGVATAAKYDALSADHLEYLSEANVRLMSERKVVAVLLPSAWYFLRETKLPPIDLLQKYQVPMAIATDCNPGSSPNTSLLLTLNMACTCFRLTPLQALLGVTKHAASALGIGATHGSLELGKAADFVIWDIDHPADLCYYLGNNQMVCRIKNGNKT